MKTVYLEHSYLANEENWKCITHFLKKSDYRAVVSDWNVIEISQATDKKQAQKRVEFIESLKPLWIINKIEIQRREVQSFLYRSFYNELIWPYCVFTENFHETVGISISREPQGGWKLQGFVNAYMSDPKILLPINEQKQDYLKTYQQIKDIGLDKIKEKEGVILSHWIKDVLPHHKPNGVLITGEERGLALQYCLENKQKFFDYCPYFKFEDALFIQRFADGKRKPRESDAIDLEHICCAVPYCEFVVAEKYLKHIATITNINLKMGKVVSNISEIPII